MNTALEFLCYTGGTAVLLASLGFVVLVIRELRDGE